jgi:serine protease Do
VVVAHSSMRSGLMVENITPQLGDFFGVKNGKGVLIRSVEKGSRADKSGFRAGDVIVRVNDQPVNDTSDFSHAIRSVTSGSATVGVIREKREQNLTLPLPERKDSGEMQEESLDAPEFDAEVTVNWAKLRDEMAQLKPQLQFAFQESRRALEEARPEIEKAQREAQEELERAKPEIEKALRAAQDAADEIRTELCAKERELRQRSQQLQKELGKQRRESLRQNRRMLERLRHEMHGDWMQI